MNPDVNDIKAGDYVKLSPFQHEITKGSSMYFEDERKVVGIDKYNEIYPIRVEDGGLASSPYARRLASSPYARNELLVKGVDYT